MPAQRSLIGDGHHSAAIEDFLRVVIELEDAGEAQATANIAERLQITCASVTQMSQRLARLGLVEYLPYHALRLTTEGRHAAEFIRSRHRLMCAFLECELGYAPAAAHTDADRLEHAMSQELCSRIKRQLVRAGVADTLSRP